MGDRATEAQHPSKMHSTEAPTIIHHENTQLEPGWKTAKQVDGDTAMALFNDPDELHEEVDPAEARRVLWKIDMMILPYLAVCYAFFYIDKVGWRQSNSSLDYTDVRSRYSDDSELCSYLRHRG